MATEQRKLTKTQLVSSFDSLPDDATVEDFIEHLAFILGVEQGIADLDAGRSISHAELLDRIKHWQT
jgi:hypothetical protein